MRIKNQILNDNIYKYIMSSPNYSDVLKELCIPKQEITIDMPTIRYDVSNEKDDYKYSFPYKLITCDYECRKKLRYKQQTGNRPNPFIKKNEVILEQSKNTTNNTYFFLYIWFIIMVIVIYVFIIAFLSKNSYHPLMNVIIFIFIIYFSYYMYKNLSNFKY